MISEDTRRKLSLSKTGKLNPQWGGGKTEKECPTCHKVFYTHKARFCSIACGRKGRTTPDYVKEKIALAHKGKPKLSIRGEKHPSWKGGITGWQNKVRTSLEYKNWHAAVLKRDGYKCQLCGAHPRVLHVDHIKRFADHPEFRFEVSNGRTLCAPCHRGTDTYGNNKVLK